MDNRIARPGMVGAKPQVAGTVAGREAYVLSSVI